VLKEYARRTISRKRSTSLKLAYSHVAAKIARISYAILTNSTSFDPNYGIAIKPLNSANVNNKISLTDRKSIRRARNALKRMIDIEELGFLGEHVSSLAEQLDFVLQGKNFSD